MKNNEANFFIILFALLNILYNVNFDSTVNLDIKNLPENFQSMARVIIESDWNVGPGSEIVIKENSECLPGGLNITINGIDASLCIGSRLGLPTPRANEITAKAYIQPRDPFMHQSEDNHVVVCELTIGGEVVNLDYAYSDLECLKRLFEPYAEFNNPK